MLLASFKGQKPLKSKDRLGGNNSRRQEVRSGESNHTEELASLALAGASIVSSLELDKVLQVVSQQFANLLDVQVCILADWHPNPGGIKAHTTFVNPGTSKLPKGYKPVSFAETLALTEVVEKTRPVQKRVDNPSLPENERQAFKKSGITSLLLLPLIAQSKTTGLVELQDSRQPRSFSEREIYLAQTLSQQAAVAIENARLFEATRRQLQELTLLHQVSMASTEATSEDELIAKATELIHRNFYSEGTARTPFLQIQEVTHVDRRPSGPRGHRPSRLPRYCVASWRYAPRRTIPGLRYRVAVRALRSDEDR